MRFLLGLFAFTSVLHAADSAGFKTLFNGKNLSGWEGNSAFWTVKDGVITGQTTKENPTKGNTFLIWKDGEVGNFELHVSFRILADNEKKFANSGIQYRSHVIDAANFVVGGYQGDMDGDGKYLGMLYEEKGRGIVAKPGEQVRVTAADGKTKLEVSGILASPGDIIRAIHFREWNEYVIIAEGTHLRHFINGKPTADVTDLDTAHAARSGVLALQLHAGLPMTVQFKDIRLKSLP